MIKNEDVDKELYEKYNDFNKNQPKKELLNLKKDKNMKQMLLSMSQNYRNKTSRRNNNISYTADHNIKILESIWDFAKSFLESNDSRRPTFTKQNCIIFFR